MNLTLHQLSQATGCGVVRAQAWLPWMNRALEAFEIDTPARVAAFLAQVGHESCSLRYAAEIWGPSRQQLRYERDFTAAWPPSDEDDRNRLAYRLGNVNAGDGERFKGHGPIQITGRANHARVRDRLRLRYGMSVPDFEVEPDELATPQWGAMSAADYWADRNLNALADAGEFVTLTRRINGGTNGLADRQARWKTAQAALA
jgi:putative chitinase